MAYSFEALLEGGSATLLVQCDEVALLRYNIRGRNAR